MTQPRLRRRMRPRFRLPAHALAALLMAASGCAGSQSKNTAPPATLPANGDRAGGEGAVVAGDSLPQLSPALLAELRPGPPQLYGGAYLFAYSSRRARSVAVAGTFNGWVPTAHPMKRRTLAASGEAGAPDSLWYALVPVPRGRHRYKFLVDGNRWIPDPANPDRTSDGSGGVASSFVVR